MLSTYHKTILRKEFNLQNILCWTQMLCWFRYVKKTKQILFGLMEDLKVKVEKLKCCDDYHLSFNGGRKRGDTSYHCLAHRVSASITGTRCHFVWSAIGCWFSFNYILFSPELQSKLCSLRERSRRRSGRTHACCPPTHVLHWTLLSLMASSRFTHVKAWRKAFVHTDRWS